MNEDSEYVASLKSDPRSTAELIQIALEAPDSEDEGRGHAISVLHIRGTREVLDAALRFCQSADARERELGADLMGQLGYPERTFPDECTMALVRLLEREEDLDVVYSACIAAGFLCDIRVVPSVIAYASHSDEDIRFGVAYALGLMSSLCDDRATASLITLSTDSISLVRNFATFGL